MSDDDDDAIFLQEDLEDLSARQFVRKRSEPVTERPAPPPVIQPPVEAPPAPAGVAYAPAGVAAPRATPPSQPAPSQPAPVRAAVPEYRAYPEYDYAEEEEVEDVSAPPSGTRSGGRIAERIRRIKTALAARTGRESEPAPPARSRAPEPAPEPVPARANGTRTSVRGGPGHGGPGQVASVPGLEDADEASRNPRGNWRAKQLARVRRRLGMTQAEFARCFGLSTDDVVRWEAGARPARAERVLLTLIMHDPEEMARLVDEAMPLK